MITSAELLQLRRTLIAEIRTVATIPAPGLSADEALAQIRGLLAGYEQAVSS